MALASSQRTHQQNSRYVAGSGAPRSLLPICRPTTRPWLKSNSSKSATCCTCQGRKFAFLNFESHAEAVKVQTGGRWYFCACPQGSGKFRRLKISIRRISAQQSRKKKTRSTGCWSNLAQSSADEIIIIIIEYIYIYIFVAPFATEVFLSIFFFHSRYL